MIEAPTLSPGRLVDDVEARLQVIARKVQNTQAEHMIANPPGSRVQR
jgi:hypothetical protein